MLNHMIIWKFWMARGAGDRDRNKNRLLGHTDSEKAAFERYIAIKRAKG